MVRFNTAWQTHCELIPSSSTAATTQRGQSSVIFIMLASALVMLGGLVYDGAQILNAKRQASLLAREAARAGAQAISTDSVYEGEFLAINQVHAHYAVANFLHPHEDWSVSVWEDKVVTKVWLTQPVQILSMLGLDSKQVVGTGTARAVLGIRTEGKR